MVIQIVYLSLVISFHFTRIVAQFGQQVDKCYLRGVVIVFYAVFNSFVSLLRLQKSVLALGVLLFQIFRLQKQLQLYQLFKLHILKLLFLPPPLKHIIQLIPPANVRPQPLILFLDFPVFLSHVQYLIVYVLFVELVLQNGYGVYPALVNDFEAGVDGFVVALGDFAPEAVMKCID